MVRIDQPAKPTLVNFDPLVPEKKVSQHWSCDSSHIVTTMQVTKVMREPTPYHKDLHSKVKQWRVARDVVTDTTNVSRLVCVLIVAHTCTMVYMAVPNQWTGLKWNGMDWNDCKSALS